MSEVKYWQSWIITDKIQRFESCPELFVEYSDYESLQSQLDEANNEIENLKLDLADRTEKYKLFMDKGLYELHNENQRLRTALEFYADPNHWKELSFNEGHEGFAARFNLTSDHGVIARQSLNMGEKR